MKKGFKMTEEQRKKVSEAHKGQIAGGIILLILLLGWAFRWWDNSEYTDCVDSCVQDHNYCVSSSIDFDNSGDGWIYEYDYEDCFNDLDFCVSDCDS